jgi:ariadne-1
MAYIEFQIKHDASCIWTRCPFPKCNELVHENAFKIFAPGELYAVYDKYLNRSIVLENPVAKFCPAPNCTNAIQTDRTNRKAPVVCDCGFQWCFICADYEIGDHIPANCEDMDAWKQKASDESENVKWMVANTKRCPQCRSSIEKNGGCMHMTCRKEAGGCGHEFCWLCRGSWKEHGSHTGGYYNCNKYEASNAKTEDDSAAKLKTELERYQFFYTRFEAHRDAMKIASKQLQNCELKSEEIQKHFRVRAEDTTFLREATETLLRNRALLKNSYIYGFYIAKKPTPKELFEYSQEQLEKFTNRLSELYERSTESIKNYDEFILWKNETIKFTSMVENFRSRFVEGIVSANKQD